MSDIVSAFGQPVLVALDDQPAITFPKLSVYEIAAECNRIKTANVAAVRKTLKECGVTGVEAMKMIRAAESEEPTVQALWAEAYAPATGVELLVKSLAKDGKSPDQAKEIISRLDPESLLKTALAVVGFIDKREETKEVDPKKADEPVGFKR